MNVRPPLVPDDKAPKSMNPPKRPLDDPSIAAESRARLDAFAGDSRRDAAHAGRDAEGAIIVSLVRMELLRPSPWTTFPESVRHQQLAHAHTGVQRLRLSSNRTQRHGVATGGRRDVEVHVRPSTPERRRLQKIHGGFTASLHRPRAGGRLSGGSTTDPAPLHTKEGLHARFDDRAGDFASRHAEPERRPHR